MGVSLGSRGLGAWATGARSSCEVGWLPSDTSASGAAPWTDLPDREHLPARVPNKVRLLPLLTVLGKRPALTTPIGVNASGTPVSWDLMKPSTWHVRVQASEPGPAAEFLRTLVIGLAASSRPSQLQMAAIDLRGSGLGILEALPHGLTQTALRVDFAIEILSWMAAEIRRQRAQAGRRSQLAVVIDDLADLEAQGGRAASRLLNQILSTGSLAGVHVLAAHGSAGRPLPGSRLRWDDDVALVGELPSPSTPGDQADWAVIHAAGGTVRLETAWLPAADLDIVIRRIRDDGGKSGEAARGGEETVEPAKLGAQPG